MNFSLHTLGTTLLLSILDGATLWVANVGDSRGVLRSSRGEVIPLSFDHKPSQVNYLGLYICPVYKVDRICRLECVGLTIGVANVVIL